MEKNFVYVETQGFINICDVNFNENENIDEIYDNCSVYLNADKLSDFATKLKNIKTHFVLITGNSDNENYKQNFDSYEQFENFVSDDKIIHWFCQNSTVSHPKITNLPIGVTYEEYSFLNAYYKDNSSIESPLEQEQILIRIKNESKPFHQRKKTCYINFKVNHNSTYKYDREEALEIIPDKISFKEQENQDRYKCWRNQIDYAFVVSPFGVGLDCLRTWEALILGCIPIVRSSGMNPLFDDLPVLIINNWTEVTRELLDTTIEKFKHRSFNYEKLKLNYWADKINQYKKLKGENFALYKNDGTNIFYIFLIFLLFILFLYYVIRALLCSKNTSMLKNKRKNGLY